MFHGKIQSWRFTTYGLKKCLTKFGHLPDGKTLRLVRMRDLHGGISLLFSDMTDSVKLKTELGKAN